MKNEARIAELEAEVARLRRANDTLIDALANQHAPVIIQYPPVIHPAPTYTPPYWQSPYIVTCDSASSITYDDGHQFTLTNCTVGVN